MYMKVKRI